MPREKSTSPSATTAARKLAQAQRLVAQARLQLAQTRRDLNSSSYVFSGAWRAADSARERSRPELHKVHGFVGHGLGFRVKSGIETDEPCVAVFVRRKLSSQTMAKAAHVAVPPHLANGRIKVATDVVEIRRIKPHFGLASIGPTLGAEFGTIGAVAFDVVTHDRVAITAMHVAGLGSFGPATVAAGIPFSTPNQAATNGNLVLGTTTEIDAAKIVLADPGSVMPPLPVVDVRPLSNDANTVVHMFGAVSGQQSGIIKYLNVDVPELQLTQTLLVDIQTTNGDSGSGLLDESNFLLGFLYGMAPADVAPNLKLFCPADLVMRRLGCSFQ